MPLTDEQAAALKLIAAADAEEVAEALKSEAQPIYQRIFRGGHATASNAAKAEKHALEEAIAAEKERAAALDAELAELKAKAPDRAQIDSQWQQKLDREKQALQAKIDAAQAKVARLTTDTTAEKAENALLAAGFRPRLAKLLAKDGAARVQYGEDGQPVLYESGSQIPVQIPAGKTAFQVLAEQERANADPADLTSNVDTGAGIHGGGAGGGKPSQEDIRRSTETTVHYAI